MKARLYIQMKRVLLVIAIAALSACAGMVSKIEYGLPKGSLVSKVIGVVETQRTTLINPHRSFDELSEELGVRMFKGSFCSDLSVNQIKTKIAMLCHEQGGEFSNLQCNTPDPVLYVDVRRSGRCDYSPKLSILAIENIDAPNTMWLRKIKEQRKRNWMKGMM
jgi:hypothetical protein